MPSNKDCKDGLGHNVRLSKFFWDGGCVRPPHPLDNGQYFVSSPVSVPIMVFNIITVSDRVVIIQERQSKRQARIIIVVLILTIILSSGGAHVTGIAALNSPAMHSLCGNIVNLIRVDRKLLT